MYFFHRFECNLFEENPSSMSWATIFQSLKYFISFLVPSEGSSLNGEGAGGKRNDCSRAQFPFKKSKFMVITKKQNIPNFFVKINDSLLEKCKTYKYLGVVIDEKLKWDAHMEHIMPKISKACGALARLRNCKSMEVLKHVYHALIHSYLRYGILIWGNACQSVLEPLQILVNKAARIMTFAPFGNLDLNPAYEYLKILDVTKTFLLETGKYHFKLVNHLLPLSLIHI